MKTIAVIMCLPCSNSFKLFKSLQTHNDVLSSLLYVKIFRINGKIKSKTHIFWLLFCVLAEG